MRAMLGCNTTCPNCKHQFTCCPPVPTCCSVRRSFYALSGGGLVPALAPPPPALSPSSCASPQVSPSVQLAFVLPPLVPSLPLCRATPPPPQSIHKTSATTELERLADTVRVLRQSGWYYEGISYDRSNELLKNSTVGTFLVRNSSDPRFYFSLSVQTDRGPTSVRLCYVNGYFRLDAQSHLELHMPLFGNVMELVQHYVKNNRRCENDAQVWVDPQGKLYSPILLEKPLRKDGDCASLKHLARLAVHRTLQASDRLRIRVLPPPYTQLELPASLKTYLAEYPYSI